MGCLDAATALSVCVSLCHMRYMYPPPRSVSVRLLVSYETHVSSSSLCRCASPRACAQVCMLSTDSIHISIDPSIYL